MSNRISFFLDVNGPSMTIDTGCSASLVCLHNAAQSLQNGDVDLALAGGAGLILTPATMMPMTALNFLSPDGKCYTFDSRANGYGRGEGIGIVVLKRLEDAIRDNDNIRAVIRGSRVNQDGRTAGITLPSAEAQLRNINSLYKKAGLDVDKTAFVECHGTGTKAGDWREVKAISEALATHRSKENPVYIGSIKTNVGHLEGCAGIAGLIKGVLCIENGYIPKHLNFETPNPDIDFEGSCVKVPTENTPWPMEGLRRASINCFGFGGTNAHVILDDAAHYLAERGLTAHHNTTISTDTNDTLVSPSHAASSHSREPFRVMGLQLPPLNGETHLFVVSANESLSLERSLRNLAAYVQRVGASSPRFMCDLAYTLGCRRTKLQWRTAVVASSPGELVKKLSGVSQTSLIRTSEEKLSKVAFIFGGQGAQWFAMARELLGFDSFLSSMVDANNYLKQIGCSFNLLEEMLKDESSTRINEPEIAQPATTAVQTSLVDLLMRFGVIPVAVCGHSSGEIAAAYAAGSISREAAWELAYHRGQCAASLQTPHGEAGQTDYPPGRMLAVGLSAEQAQQYVDAVGRDKVTIACINSPVSVTLSGDKDAVISIHETLEKAGIFNRLLAVTTAYHSHHMKLCESMYRHSIAHVTPQTPWRSRSPVLYSSVTGAVIEWVELSSDYWVKNMVSPVIFADAMRSMITNDAGHRPDLIVEIGPHSSLQGPIKQILDAQEKLKQKPHYLSLLARGKDASVTVLQVLGELWNRGCNFSLEEAIARNIDCHRPRLLVNLPNYPWNHGKTHWHESHLSKTNRFPKHGRYDLIGRLTLDSIPSQPRWRGFLRLSENPWIRHHQVQKTIIYPASGMIAMVLEAGKQMADSNFSGIEIKQFRIEKALIIPPTAHGLEYMVNMTKDTDRTEMAPVRNSDSSSKATSLTYRFCINSKPLDGSWQEHGDGLVTIHQEPAHAGHSEERTEQEGVYGGEKHHETCLHAVEFCDEVVIPRQLYETLDVIGMNYGSAFQNVTSLQKRDNECIATICVPDTKSMMPSTFEYPHMLHPATLDSVFHTAFALDSEPMVPTYIGSIFVSADSALSLQGHELLVHTQAQRTQPRGASAKFVVSNNLLRASARGRCKPLIVVKDMTFTALTTNPDDVGATFLPNHRGLCSEIKWEQCEQTPSLNQVSQENQPSLAQTTPVLILIPEAMSPGLQNILSAISKELNGTPRTLLSISGDEVLPRLCLSLLEADGQSLLWNISAEEYSALRTVVLKTSGVFWVTRGSQMEVSNPRCGLFQALARTVHSEYPEKNLVTFDISQDTSFAAESAADVSRRVLSLFQTSFFVSDSSDYQEVEYAERGGQTMVPRLVPVDPLNAMIEHGTSVEEPRLQLMNEEKDRALRLKVQETGNLNSLCWDDDASAYLRLSPSEVRVRVLSTALSALDVDVVMGRTIDNGIGTDVFGVVEELGEGVTNLAVGDYVLGVARGSLRDVIKCHQALLYKCPPGQVYPAHVFLPTPFSIAQYSFGGRLEPGEAILIHAGASAFGQAAIQLAELIGARAFVTVKSKHERVILRGFYDIPDSHILDATTDAWVDAVLRLTDDEGVKVVYNPTVDDADVQLEGIAEGKNHDQPGRLLLTGANKDLGGHIVRFTRKENVSGRLDTVNQVITFMALDLAYLIENEPRKIGEAFAVVCDKFLTGLFRASEPSPLKLFDYSQLPLAFKSIIEGGQCGLVYCQRPESNPVPILPRAIQPVDRYLNGNATYVISGGLGGLGREIAKLLAAHGVKHIAFLARSGVKDEVAKSCITFLENRGVQVAVFTTDICETDEVERAARRIEKTMPPVKGVFQCAAAVHDAVFENMTYENWQTAIRPKTVGSWNLKMSFAHKLDFFIFLSSSIGVIGGRGQANYAVGNAFQDALAIHINNMAGNSTHAVSIDLGPVLGAGMLAEDPRTLDMLKTSGFFGIRLQDVKKLIERAITGYMANGERMPAQVVIGVGTGGLIAQNKPADPYWTRTTLFSYLNQVDVPTAPETEGAAASGSLEEKNQSMAQLLRDASDAEEATAVVCTGLRAMLAKTMNTVADDVDENRSPAAYGVDSLVAVGVRNWVYRECGAVDLSVFEVLSDQSILELSGLIVQKGGFGG